MFKNFLDLSLFLCLLRLNERSNQRPKYLTLFMFSKFTLLMLILTCYCIPPLENIHNFLWKLKVPSYFSKFLNYQQLFEEKLSQIENYVQKCLKTSCIHDCIHHANINSCNIKQKLTLKVPSGLNLYMTIWLWNYLFMDSIIAVSFLDKFPYIVKIPFLI